MTSDDSGVTNFLTTELSLRYKKWPITMPTLETEITEPEQPQQEQDWQAGLASLLTDLSAAQTELLAVLSQKRQLLAESNAEGLLALQQKEQNLIDRLEQCQRRRVQLLEAAANDGMPSDSIRSLSGALPDGKRETMGRQVKEVTSRARLLQHHSLTNWVVAQRTLLHLSQLLEIIATGGRPQPTYGEGESAYSSGSLVDRAV